MTRNVRLQGMTVGGKDRGERMAAAIAFHRMRPALEEKRFAFDDLAQALEGLSRGAHFGKVVCEDFQA